MKPGPWWRAQNACVDSPKLIKLTDKQHRNWFNLNCVANSYAGALPDLETVAIKLRVTPAKAEAIIAELVDKKLFDRREDGSVIPHDWNEWQFKTDGADPTNNERQRRHRAKHQDELKQLRAIRDNAHNALRNGVNNGSKTVSIKRPETETDITTTVRVERGLGNEGSKIDIPSLGREGQELMRKLNT